MNRLIQFGRRFSLQTGTDVEGRSPRELAFATILTLATVNSELISRTRPMLLVEIVVILPKIFRLFAVKVAPYAPKSEFAFLLMMALVAAFLMVGHRSVYASQKLGLAKSAGLDVTLGGAIGDYDRASVKVRKGSLTERVHTLVQHWPHEQSDTPLEETQEMKDRP